HCLSVFCAAEGKKTDCSDCRVQHPPQRSGDECRAGYVKAAVRAMSRIPGLTFDVTPMSSVLEAENIGTILEAVEVSHRILRSMGAKRISSSLRIDERLDKHRKMSDKTKGLKRSTMQDRSKLPSRESALASREKNCGPPSSRGLSPS